jgi:glycosyltransferase involved in cell wall biosynthesis
VQSTPVASENTQHNASRTFDGVICFGGEDWWYHNRGHYDMQMMRNFSRTLPVLYINSIGMRTPHPGEGRMFYRRINRKLKSISRGLVRVSDDLMVFSPLVLPSKLGIRLTRPFLKAAVHWAAAKQQIRQPLLWVACPTGAEVVDHLNPEAVVYQRTDRFECFRGVDKARILEYDGWLKARADLTVFCSSLLFSEESADCRRAALIDHGVDVDRFLPNEDRPFEEPADMVTLRHPRVGFIGGIDAHTFDVSLFLATARRMADVQFVLVGACSLPDGWCDLPNVVQLGQKPYERVADYMAACDVLIMPWNQSPWIQACNPVKLKEYLATGRPVVSTEFPELDRYEGLVERAQGTDGFIAAIRRVLKNPGDPVPGQLRVQREQWSKKALQAFSVLASCGITTKAPIATRDHTEPGLASTVQNTVVSTPHTDPSTTGPSQPSTTPTIFERPASQRIGSARVPDIKACIILAGGLQPSPLMQETGLSILDLPLTSTATVLDWWLDHVRVVAKNLHRSIPIYILHNSHVPVPWPRREPDLDITYIHDPLPLRGPAGVIRDACAQLPPDGDILVFEAARYMGGTLWSMMQQHAATGADATVATNTDHTPAGIYLLRSELLAMVPAAGYVDLKEQWLDRLVCAERDVRRYVLPGAGSLHLHDRASLLRAASLASGVSTDAPPSHVEPKPTSMTAPNQMSLRIICRGAAVDPTAIILNSIIMPGATVGSHALIVRSLICPNTRVQTGTDIADAIVAEDVCLSDVA